MQIRTLDEILTASEIIQHEVGQVLTGARRREREGELERGRERQSNRERNRFSHL